MDSRVKAFFAGLKKKKITVVGIGVSNTGVIRQMASAGAIVTACDRRSREQLGEICSSLEAQGVTLCLGEDYLDNLDADIIIRTPGLSFYKPQLQEAIARGIVVTSEMEMFFDLCPCPIIAVTGSDGKTTTTTLIAEMLTRQGKKVHLGGNIGRALLPIVGEINRTDYAVVELSSFQLMSMRRSPQTAVILNVTPNHLDVHKNMEEYIAAKENLILHQNAFSRAVLGADNEITAAMAEKVRGECLFFSRKKTLTAGAFATEDGSIWMAHKGQVTHVMHTSDIKIPGTHNVENYLAAITALWGVVEPSVMRQVAQTFEGVEHRIEFIRELDGVRWYNDSIATSPTRTIAGLNCFKDKIILIAGGYDKKIPFAPLAPRIMEKVKVLVLLGQTAAKIEEAVVSTPGYETSGLEIIRAESMEDAVLKARDAAKPGDIISLSPACASFDMYPNFEARGRHFKELVNLLSPLAEKRKEWN